MHKTNIDSGERAALERQERDFFRIMQVSTALGMAVLGAFLASIKDMAHDASLEFSVWTVIACVVCGGLGLGFWPLMRRLGAKSLPRGASDHSSGHER